MRMPKLLFLKTLKRKQKGKEEDVKAQTPLLCARNMKLQPSRCLVEQSRDTGNHYKLKGEGRN